jgi:hypothetical protein
MVVVTAAEVDEPVIMTAAVPAAVQGGILVMAVTEGPLIMTVCLELLVQAAVEAGAKAAQVVPEAVVVWDLMEKAPREPMVLQVMVVLAVQAA